MNKEGAIAGICWSILYFWIHCILCIFRWNKEDYLFGIDPTGIGTIGTLLHLMVAFVVSRMTPEPPAQRFKSLVERIRIPSGVGEALDH